MRSAPKCLALLTHKDSPCAQCDLAEAERLLDDLANDDIDLGEVLVQRTMTFLARRKAKEQR